jgi:hypothetical protein
MDDRVAHISGIEVETVVIVLAGPGRRPPKLEAILVGVRIDQWAKRVRKNVVSDKPGALLDDNDHQVERLVRDELQNVVVVLDVRFTNVDLAGADVWVEVAVFIHHKICLD